MSTSNSLILSLISLTFFIMSGVNGGNPIVDCNSETSDSWITSVITFYGRNVKYFRVYPSGKLYQWIDGTSKGGLSYSDAFKDSNGNQLSEIRFCS